MSNSYTLPTEPEGMVATLLERFNSGQVSGDENGLRGVYAHHRAASDILRRGADGLWRYIIDNNQGTAVRKAA